MPAGRPLTDAELDEWRRVYPTGGTAAVQALYPHRSRGSIKVNAHKRGIKVDPEVGYFLRYTSQKTRSNGWRPHEDLVLYLHYKTKPMSELVALLPGRTAFAIRTRAVVLDIAYPQSKVLRAKYEAERESV